MQSLRVYETFLSIQGESTYAGCPCFFIRLAGCNLRCRYCDTSYAWVGGKEMSILQLVQKADASGAGVVEITGGEPLVQDGVPALARELLKAKGRRVLLETNGSRDISVVPERVVRIVDVKCPGSGAGESFLESNIRHLGPNDEVKFVLGDRKDFDWARRFTEGHSLVSKVNAVLFSPVNGKLKPGKLADWILDCGLNVRLQVQIHRLAGLR